MTTRKRKSTDGNPDQKKRTNTVKNQSKNVENVIRHVAGEGLEKQRPLKSVVVFVGVDEEGYEFKLTSKVFNF